MMPGSSLRVGSGSKLASAARTPASKLIQPGRSPPTRTRWLTCSPSALATPLCISDERSRLGCLEAVTDVFGGQQRRAGNRHSAQSNEAEHRQPPLWQARSDQQNPIARADAQVVEEARGAVRVLGDLPERVPLFLCAALADAPERRSVGPLPGPAFNDIAGEIEVQWRPGDHGEKLTPIFMSRQQRRAGAVS